MLITIDITYHMNTFYQIYTRKYDTINILRIISDLLFQLDNNTGNILLTLFNSYSYSSLIDFTKFKILTINIVASGIRSILYCEHFIHLIAPK